MTHHEHLAQVDRFIAECKNRIERQREVIATAYENGHPTVLPVALLRALEENLRSYEKYRHLVLDEIKKGTSSTTAIDRTAAQSAMPTACWNAVI
jgi:hypothetical protein